MLRHRVGLDERFVDVEMVVKKVIVGLKNMIMLTQFVNFVAETAAYMVSDHPDYGALGRSSGEQSISSISR